jgi:hypothetical protein
MNKEIKIELPKGFMNVGISTDNILIADTNDSANWDTISFPLPEPKGTWNILRYEQDFKIVVLEDVRMTKQQITEYLIGKTEKDCSDICSEFGFSFRVMLENGEMRLGTADLNFNRLNLHVYNGLITKCNFG